MTKYAVALAVGVTLLGIRSPSTGSVDRTADELAVIQFNRGIAAYLQLRADVERQVPPPAVGATAARIHRVVAARAAMMRTLRATARRGDIFTPLVAETFRVRIADALEATGTTLDAVLGALNDELEPVHATPGINAPFASARWPTSFSTLTDALPELPPRMQFRFVNWDLVLVDTETGLVVDVLPDALPTPTT